MTRIRLTIAYVGTAYHGWQRQKNAPSIQELLEEKLSRICASPVRLHASGRTDAGVHALGQVAHFDPPAGREHIPWQKALRAMLPPDIAILDVQKVDTDFHARFSVCSKRYAYTLWTKPDFVLPHRAPFVWAVRDLDLARMDVCAAGLAGRHDFAAFQNAGTEIRGTWRTLEPIVRRSGREAGEWVFYFKADGFLKQMVRNLMGLLVAVGQGRREPEEGASLLQSLDRRQAPATAPAQGLCLEEVFY